MERSTAPRRWLWLVAGLAAFVLGAVLALWGGRERSAVALVEGATAQSAAAELRGLPSATDPDDAHERRAVAEPEDVALATDAAAGATEIVVRCVRLGSTEPVSGAEVFALSAYRMWTGWLRDGVRAGLDVRDVLRRAGPGVITDADGLARIAVHDSDWESGLAIVAVTDALEGLVWEVEPGADEVLVRLEEPMSARARVLGADGTPASGVVVSLLLHEAPLGAARTDADGFADVRVCPWFGIDSFLSVRVRAEGVFRRPVERFIGLLGAHAGDVELRLPPVGRVRVAPPRDAASAALVTWVGAPPAADVWSRADALVATLRASALDLGPVEVGVPVVVEARALHSGVPWRGSGPGPARPGDVVDVVLARDPYLEVRGRAVDEEGRPLARARLWSDFEEGGAEEQVELTTDRDGRFVWRTPVAHEERGTADWNASHDGLYRTATIDVDLALLTGDAGDVTFRASSVAVRGRLLGADGAPVARAAVVLKEIGGDLLSEVGRRWRGDGYFELRAEPIDGVFEVAAWSAGHMAASRRVTFGQDVGEWRLERCALVRGRVLADERVLAAGLDVVVGGNLDVWPATEGRHPVARDGTFEVPRVRPDAISLWLDAPNWIGEPVLVGRGSVDAGVELGDIDLSGRVALTALVVEDAEGAPRRACVLAREWPGHGPLGPRWLATAVRARSSASDEILVLHGSEPVRVQLRAEGHRAVDIELVGSTLDVLLEPALAVRVRVLGAEDFREPLLLRVEAVESPSGVAIHSLVDGTVDLALPAPGRWGLRVVPDEYGAYTSASTDVIEVLDTSALQSFELALPDWARDSRQRRQSAGSR